MSDLEVEVDEVRNELETELPGLGPQAGGGPVDGEQEVTQRLQLRVGLLPVLDRDKTLAPTFKPPGLLTYLELRQRREDDGSILCFVDD